MRRHLVVNYVRTNDDPGVSAAALLHLIISLAEADEAEAWAAACKRSEQPRKTEENG